MLTENAKLKTSADLTISGRNTSITQVVAAAKNGSFVSLTDDPEVLGRVARSAATVAQAVERGECIYGVTTGFGGMADQPVPAELAVASQNNLLSFLATGAGPAIAERHVRGNVLASQCVAARVFGSSTGGH